MKNSAKYLSTLLLCMIFSVSFSLAQQIKGKVKILSIETFSELDLMKKMALNVYMDCETCDKDFIKKELTFVNNVRDRKEADIHILITTQETGSGGIEHAINLIGQNQFSDIQDTLIYISKGTDTEDNIRRGLLRNLKIGLIPFVLKTPIADKISIYFEEDVDPTATEDKWDFWVFNLGFYGKTSGQKTMNFSSYSGDLSANRVTEKSKLRLGISANFDKSNYEFEETTISTFSESEKIKGLFVKSLGQHWSMGIWADFNSSTFSNLQLDLHGGYGVEYSIFPYSESTRKLITLLYRIGYNYSKYREETIFDKLSEHLYGESLTITAEIKQPWGNIAISLEGFHYFHDFNKNRLDLYGGFSVNLLKGLFFEVWGGYSHIHDQLSLPKGGATFEEILLQRKELATNYYYNVSLGLSYTFGSIYSNIVNPRFGR